MKFYIKRDKSNVDAILEYDKEKKLFIVLKGSRVSDSIAHSEKFRGAKSIERARGNGVVVECVVTKNVQFKSASTAANFVTGASTNGLIVWKSKDGRTMKAVLEGGQKDE
ncbi:MAG: DUF4357 domain-containing protein [Lachnospiraceae bacterium]|nr:DUF4357 domain-containing protein [Lachnospiraceae bacterium]